jgi:hypothetical protein
LFLHVLRRAASRACWTAGNNSAIKIAMMAITTSSSISVNPKLHRERLCLETRFIFCAFYKTDKRKMNLDRRIKDVRRILEGEKIMILVEEALLTLGSQKGISILNSITL